MPKKEKVKTRPKEVSFKELLQKEYDKVIKEHGDFKSIVWDGKEKEFIVNL